FTQIRQHLLIRIFAMLIATIAAIYLTTLMIRHYKNVDGNLLAKDIALWFGCGVIYTLHIHKALPRQIIINVDNIIIYEYSTQKRTKINYTEISDIRTFDQSTDSRNNNTTSFRILQIELSSGEIYRISENDFTNYDFLERAIYQHYSENR